MITKDDTHFKNHEVENASTNFSIPEPSIPSVNGVFKRSSIRPSSSLKRSVFRVKSIGSRRKTPSLKNDLIKDIKL